MLKPSHWVYAYRQCLKYMEERDMSVSLTIWPWVSISVTDLNHQSNLVAVYDCNFRFWRFQICHVSPHCVNLLTRAPQLADAGNGGSSKKVFTLLSLGCNQGWQNHFLTASEKCFLSFWSKITSFGGFAVVFALHSVSTGWVLQYKYWYSCTTSK